MVITLLPLQVWFTDHVLRAPSALPECLLELAKLRSDPGYAESESAFHQDPRVIPLHVLIPGESLSKDPFVGRHRKSPLILGCLFVLFYFAPKKKRGGGVGPV